MDAAPLLQLPVRLQSAGIWTIVTTGGVVTSTAAEAKLVLSAACRAVSRELRKLLPPPTAEPEALLLVQLGQLLLPGRAEEAFTAC